MLPEGKDIRERVEAAKQRGSFTPKQEMLLDALSMIGQAMEKKLARQLTNDEIFVNIIRLELEEKWGRELTEEELSGLFEEAREYHENPQRFKELYFDK